VVAAIERAPHLFVSSAPPLLPCRATTPRGRAGLGTASSLPHLVSPGDHGKRAEGAAPAGTIWQDARTMDAS
jgi:hypothetical protein